jgi:hypothetical protein
MGEAVATRGADGISDRRPDRRPDRRRVVPGQRRGDRALLDAGANAEPLQDVKPGSRLAWRRCGRSRDSAAKHSRAARKPRPNPSGNSPVSKAITSGRADVVRTLIRAGGDRLVERIGVNPLHWATITNRPDVTLACQAGVTSTRSTTGFTPRCTATIDFGDAATLSASPQWRRPTIKNESDGPLFSRRDGSATRALRVFSLSNNRHDHHHTSRDLSCSNTSTTHLTSLLLRAVRKRVRCCPHADRALRANARVVQVRNVLVTPSRSHQADELNSLPPSHPMSRAAQKTGDRRIS